MNSYMYNYVNLNLLMTVYACNTHKIESPSMRVNYLPMMRIFTFLFLRKSLYYDYLKKCMMGR